MRRKYPVHDPDMDGAEEFARTLCTIAQCLFIVLMLWLAMQCLDRYQSDRVDHDQARKNEQVHDWLARRHGPRAASQVVYTQDAAYYYYPSPDTRQEIPPCPNAR